MQSTHLSAFHTLIHLIPRQLRTLVGGSYSAVAAAIVVAVVVSQVPPMGRIVKIGGLDKCLWV